MFKAYRKARTGNKRSVAVMSFTHNLERELILLENELVNKTYCVSGYNSFWIHEPKKRLISAANFRDRVVHHALCNVIEPILDKSLIPDTYANRKDKGLHRAIQRAHAYLKKYPFYLKTDIRKYFPSIDHEILKKQLERKIACPDTLHLINQIIASGANLQNRQLSLFKGDDLFSSSQRTMGLPIGNLTSQIFANYFLSDIDHFIKEDLRSPGYVRYMDDFVLFGNSKEELQAYLKILVDRLQSKRLDLHPNKTFIRPSNRGLSFCGLLLNNKGKRLVGRNFRRSRKRIRQRIKSYHLGKLSSLSLECSLNSYRGQFRFIRASTLEAHFYTLAKNEGVALETYPSGAWRVLEQQQQELSSFEPQQKQT